jgi:hypothetical protein
VKSVIYPISAAVAFAAVFWRLLLLRQGRDPASVTVAICFALAGIVFTTSTPAVSAWLDRTTGVPNVGAFCIHMSAVALSFAIQVQVINWAYDPEVARPKIRTRLVALAAVIAVMTVLFVLMSQPSRQDHYLLTGAETGGTRFTIYLGFYLAALGVGYSTSAWMSWQFAKVCREPWLRRGLLVSAAGFAMTLLYVATRAGSLVGARLGADPESYEFLVPVFAGLSLLLTLVGLSLPASGPRLSALAAGVRRWRDLRRLEPLWRAFYDAVPGIALDPPAPGPWRPRLPREVGLRLLRRVVEISDGRLAVAPYVPASVEPAARARAEAAGLRGEELAAVVEASRIAAGLAALRRRDEPVRGGAPAGATPGGDDLPAEVARLVRVTRAFTSSPVVAEFRSGAVPAAGEPREVPAPGGADVVTGPAEA